MDGRKRREGAGGEIFLSEWRTRSSQVADCDEAEKCGKRMIFGFSTEFPHRGEHMLGT